MHCFQQFNREYRIQIKCDKKELIFFNFFLNLKRETKILQGNYGKKIMLFFFQTTASVVAKAMIEVKHIES